jgi:carbamoyl-phosphate synthase large subunit
MKSDELIEYIKTPKWDRIFRIKDALMQGVTIKTIVQATFIDRWFIYQIQEIVRIEKELIQHTLDSLPEELLKEAKQNGFGDEQIARILIDRCTEEQVYEKRKALGITRVYKMVDTCSAEI